MVDGVGGDEVEAVGYYCWGGGVWGCGGEEEVGGEEGDVGEGGVAWWGGGAGCCCGVDSACAYIIGKLGGGLALGEEASSPAKPVLYTSGMTEMPASTQSAPNEAARRVWSTLMRL